MGLAHDESFDREFTGRTAELDLFRRSALDVAKQGFFTGKSLSALDLGWASFAALIQPLPNDLCSMDPMWRDLYTWTPAETAPVKVAELLAHRDHIYRGWMELPVSLQ